MDKDVNNFQINVAPYENFTLVADLTGKEKETKLVLESEGRPKSSLLVVEAESKTPEKFMFRQKGAKNTILFTLDNLAESGKQTKVVIAEKNWISFTFQNHENKPVTVQVTAESE